LSISLVKIGNLKFDSLDHLAVLLFQPIYSFDSSDKQRFELDRKIIELDFDETELSGSLAQRRKNVEKKRNLKIMKVSYYIFFKLSEQSL
jgi:hypothetical protein